MGLKTIDVKISFQNKPEAICFVQFAIEFKHQMKYVGVGAIREIKLKSWLKITKIMKNSIFDHFWNITSKNRLSFSISICRWYETSIHAPSSLGIFGADFPRLFSN